MSHQTKAAQLAEQLYPNPENPQFPDHFSERRIGFLAGFEAAKAESDEQLKEAIEHLKKAQNIIVEDECEECGTFKGVRYEVTPIKEFLEKISGKALEDCK